MSPGRGQDYQVRLLGQFHLTIDGRPVPGPTTARLQSLLAYLLLHADAPQSRAHLSFAFWPDAYYVLVSLQDTERPVVRAFRILDGAVSEEELRTL